MEKDTYQLLLEGTFVSGCSANKAKNSLSKIFHIDLAKIDKLFENAPVVIKKNLSYEKALKFQEIVEKTGAFCKVQPETNTIGAKKEDVPRVETKSKNTKICPKCESPTDIEIDECSVCGVIISKYNSDRILRHKNNEKMPETRDSRPDTSIGAFFSLKGIGLAGLVLIGLVYWFYFDSGPKISEEQNAPVSMETSNETPSSSTQDEVRNNETIKNLEKKLEQKRFELEERNRRLSVLEKDLENIEYMENAVPSGPGKVIHRSFSTSMGMKTKEYVIEQIEKVEDYVYALENEIYTLENEIWELE